MLQTAKNDAFVCVFVVCCVFVCFSIAPFTFPTHLEQVRRSSSSIGQLSTVIHTHTHDACDYDCLYHTQASLHAHTICTQRAAPRSAAHKKSNLYLIALYTSRVAAAAAQPSCLRSRARLHGVMASSSSSRSSNSTTRQGFFSGQIIEDLKASDVVHVNIILVYICYTQWGTENTAVVSVQERARARATRTKCARASTHAMYIHTCSSRHMRLSRSRRNHVPRTQHNKCESLVRRGRAISAN